MVYFNLLINVWQLNFVILNFLNIDINFLMIIMIFIYESFLISDSCVFVKIKNKIILKYD